MNLVSLVLLFFSQAMLAHADMVTVPEVDVTRYIGNWYQIARKPIPFEAGCVCSRQQLSITKSGLVSVYNTCNNVTVDGPLREIRGTASPDDATNSKLTVDFGLPRKGAYWIIGLDENYRYAVVSEPSKSVLYILSKTPVLAPELLEEALQKAAAQVDLSDLSMTLQENCIYPNK